MKIFRDIIFILIILTALKAYSEDNSTDNQGENSKIVKFRGGIYLPMHWAFPYDRTKSDNHISLPSYSYYYDYTDDGDPKYKHHKKGDLGSVISPTYLNGKALFGCYYSIILPLLKTDHFLLNSNEVKFTVSTDITPVSLVSCVDISFTPVAFLSFDAGVQIGTGWNIDGIGAGLARDNSGGVIKNEYKDILMKDSFYGPLLKTWLSATLQLEISAVMPESYQRWTHIKILAIPSFEFMELLNYGYYDRAFYWELDRKLNGWTFTCDFSLQYKIPVIEDPRKDEAENKMFMGAVKHNNFMITLGLWTSLYFMLTHYNDSPMRNHGWGSDFIECSFGPNIIFDLPYNFSFLIGFIWKNGMIYSSDSIGNNDSNKYKYEDWRIFFEKIAWSFSWDF